MSSSFFTPLKQLSKFLIIMAMSAIGLKTNLVAMVKSSGKSIILGAICWIAIILTSLGMQTLIGIFLTQKVAHQLPFSYASSIKRVCSLLMQRFITISSHPPARKISSASRLSSPSCAQKILASALRKSRATSGRNSLRR